MQGYTQFKQLVPDKYVPEVHDRQLEDVVQLTQGDTQVKQLPLSKYFPSKQLEQVLTSVHCLHLG